MDVVVTLAIGLLGGGGIVGLVALWANRRKTTAEATKVESDVASVVEATYGKMLDRLKARIDEIEDDNAKCHSERSLARSDLAASILVISEMRIAVTDAQAEAKVARAAVVVLQDRLDRLETGQNNLVEMLDAEIVKRENGG